MRYPDVLFYLPLSYRTNDTARRTYVLSPLKSGVGVHLCDDKQRAIRSRMQRFELFFYHFQSCEIFLQTNKFFFAMLRMECERCWPQILDAVFFRTPKNNSRWKIGNWQQKTNQDNFRRLGTTAHRTKSANLISFFFFKFHHLFLPAISLWQNVAPKTHDTSPTQSEFWIFALSERFHPKGHVPYSAYCIFQETEMAFVCFEKKKDLKTSDIHQCKDFIYIYYYVWRIIKCINKWLEYWKGKETWKEAKRTQTHSHINFHRLRQSMFSYSGILFWPCSRVRASLRLRIVSIETWLPPKILLCTFKRRARIIKTWKGRQRRKKMEQKQQTPFASKERKLYEIILIYLRWQLDTIIVYVKDA